jgi:predicted MFS family arabinose efflux permease
MAILHGLGGLAVGCGLSFTHSTMGASGNPHRLVAIGFAALSLLSLVFLSTMPRHVHSTGGPVLFVVLGSIMLVAALAATAWFPPPESAGHREVRQEHTPIPRGVWFAMAGISFMTLNQAMMFSFLERMGVARGFSQQELMRMLLLCGVVNLFPAILAAAMERRLSSRAVMLAGPALQGSLGLVITQSPVFAPYAVAASVYVATLIFTHTFVFGFLARSDRSTRAVAATPVMTMAGSAMGPFVGGAVAQNLGGYSSIGWAATIVSILGVYCFWQAHRGLVAAPRSIDPRADLAGPGVR